MCGSRGCRSGYGANNGHVGQIEQQQYVTANQSRCKNRYGLLPQIASARLATAAAANPAACAEIDRRVRSQRPVNIPITAVPIAGRSLSRPSVSRRLWSGTSRYR